MAALEYYNHIKQYWQYEIRLTIATSIVVFALLYFGTTPISNLPRSAMALFATILSTLLGLTLTAFSILIAFMRNFTVDFLQTNTFFNIGRLFRLIMVLELLSLVISVLTYVVYGSSFYEIGLFMAIFTLSLSLVYFWLLLNKIFRMFSIARNDLIKTQ